MKSLLKFALFCLFFLSFSQVGFGQVDSTNSKVGVSKDYYYLDSAYLKNITILESTKTTTGWIDKVRNNKTNAISNLIHEYATLPKNLPDNKRNVPYPTAAVKNNISGTVVAQITITEDGEVKDIKILQSAHPTLDNAVIKFFTTLPRYVPAKINGKPVSVVVKFTLPFVLK